MTCRPANRRSETPRATPRGRALFTGIALLAVLGLAPAAGAQVFRVQAGASSLYQAQGGSLYVRAANYDATIGVGTLDPFRVGITVNTRVRSADLMLGDANIPFRLPTDVFDAGHSFLGRGVGVGYSTEDVRLFVMGGMTSTGFSTPYTFGAQPNDPVGLCFLEGIVSPTVRVSARSLFSEKATTILGLDWNPTSYLGGALAGGAGSESGYLAASMRFERDFASVKAGFVHAGDQFHRVILPRPEGSEMDGPNAQVTVRPQRNLTLTAAHNNYLQPSSLGQPAARGSVNQFLAGGVAAGTTLNGALFQSEVSGAGGRGASFSAGRDVTRYLKLSGMVMRNLPRLGPASTQWVGNVREVISPKLELLQVLNTGGGNTSVSFGGSYTSNRFSAGVDYQTIYVPFAVQNQFRQALMLHVRLQAVSNLQANLSSYIGPDGDVKYTVYASQFLYRGESYAAPSQQSIYDNVIRGIVTDEAGNRVSGAALEVDGDIAYTDSQGSFLVRKSKAKEYALEVKVDEFLTPGRYEVVHAPERVQARPEASATDVFITVKRLPSASSN